jgi:hypothetical protein
MAPRSGVPSVRRHRDRTASAQAPASDQCQHGPVPTPWLADRCSAESGGESVSIVCSSPQPSYYLRAEDQRLLIQRCYCFFEARIEQSCVIATLHTQITCAMDRTHGNRRISHNKASPTALSRDFAASICTLCDRALHLGTRLAPQKRINVPETIKLLTKSRRQCAWGAGV